MTVSVVKFAMAHQSAKITRDLAAPAGRLQAAAAEDARLYPTLGGRRA